MHTRRRRNHIPKDYLQEAKQYQAESLLACRYYFGCKFYLVKWKDYSEEQNTWQPIENLMGVINQVLILDYKLKKEFMIDHCKWKINRIQQQLNKHYQQTHISQTLNYHYKLNREESAAKHLRDSLALAEYELQALQLRFQDEQQRVTVKNHTNEPMCVEESVEVKIQEIQQSNDNDNQLLVEIDNSGQIFLFTWNQKDKQTVQYTEKYDSMQMSAIVQIQRAQRRAKNKNFDALHYTFFDFENYLLTLNDKSLIKPRKQCLQLISTLKIQRRPRREKRISCNSKSFNNFTHLQLNSNAIYLEHIQITDKEISSCLCNGYSRINIDLETLLVYFPSKLLESLKHLI